MLDHLIKNGRLVDGMNNPSWTGDIGIANGKIAAIQREINAPARRIIDGTGKYITPGFIDIHRHGDAAIFRPGFGELELRQGLTTIVNGNCGLSIIPCPKEHREAIFGFLKPVIGPVTIQEEFCDYSSYMDLVKKQPLPVNVGMLVGNGTVRAAVKGYDTGKLTKEEVKRAGGYIKQALKAGALGVSLGIVYAPEYNYDIDGFLEVLEPMKDFQVPLVTHIRGEGDIFKESVEEVIEIAGRLSVPLHISHLKCIGERNWGHGVREVLKLLEDAREGGMEVSCDVYPYTAGSTQLVQILPPGFLEGGFGEIVKRLQNPEKRRDLTNLLMEPSDQFENILSSIGFENIRITTVQTDKNQQYTGKSIEEIARLKGTNPYDTVYDLLAEENCQVSMVDFITSEDDIRTILKYPYTSIISDSVYPGGGLPHPRMYGTFPKVLKQYVKKEGLLSIEEAVHKMTWLPASLYGLKNKGRLKEGADGDIIVLDLDKIDTKASYEKPAVYPRGFDYIWVNGRLAVENDRYTGVKNGTIV